MAVLNAAGPDAYLLGHSSGAIYALEVARQAELAGLILYEPPLHAFHGRFVPDILPRLRVAAEEERFEDLVSIFLSDEVGVPDEELSRMKAMPLWEQMVALAPQSMREWEELADAGLTVDRYTDVRVPTLLLAGTVTEGHPSFATQALQNALPDARVAKLEGQGHAAHEMAPEMAANVVGSFLLENVSTEAVIRGAQALEVQ